MIDKSLFIENFIGDSVKKAKSNAHILVIDDNAIVLRNIKSLLEPLYSVAVAPSGKHAFVSISNRKPDLILLDYEMPEMNGKEVMERLKTTEKTKDIPVVFLTAMDSRETVLELLTLEPAGYLLKPIDSKMLYDTLDNILGK